MFDMINMKNIHQENNKTKNPNMTSRMGGI
jgi:hypothetical protein